jgi:hypothetical protein
MLGVTCCVQCKLAIASLTARTNNINLWAAACCAGALPFAPDVLPQLQKKNRTKKEKG